MEVEIPFRVKEVVDASTDERELDRRPVPHAHWSIILNG